MMRDPREWVCVGRFCGSAAPLWRAGITAAFSAVRAAWPDRALTDRWIRYRIVLADAPDAPPGVELTAVTDDIIRAVRAHPDHDADQLRSGLKFWDHGLRGAYIWMPDGELACIQWLLTRHDYPQVLTLGPWAGMYPPLPPGTGQVENLYTFSTARRKGVATQFEFALFQAARAAGLSTLVTHIHEANAAARGWADRTGWRAYGAITRYRVDLPGVRHLTTFLHTLDRGSAPRAVPRGQPVGTVGA